MYTIIIIHSVLFWIPAQEVLEVAQNILAFLKANCTREGHTYWLFRRRGEEVVKLYDITSLMETSAEVCESRPFSLPR